ncbi:MAG: 50S ribosomal protein L9 [Alphaproteobacteria bacterium]|nr:MAG: 50S ribosomal protein L9 [Alphaproteobacteria bacterium]
MEVILLERVPHLGQMGDVVNVKPGYARNYLLPRGKALRATEANRKAFEERRKEIEARNLERRREAEAVKEKMDGAKLVVVRQAGASGQLYGSVAPRDVAAALGEQGFQIDRSQVELARPIKTIGLFEVLVRLHGEVEAKVVVNVARSEAEAEEQWRIGRALIASTEREAMGLGEEEEAEIDTEELVAELLEEEALAEREQEAVEAENAGEAEAAQPVEKAEETAEEKPEG